MSLALKRPPAMIRLRPGSPLMVAESAIYNAVIAVPEPTSAVLLAFGLSAVGELRKARRRRSNAR
jgi:hypothetical protein